MKATDTYRRRSLSLAQGLVGDHQPCFSPHTTRREIFGFPFRLISDDGDIRPGSQGFGRCSVSSALPRIASQQAEGDRRAFQRGHPRNCFRRCISLGLSCSHLGVSRAIRVTKEFHRPQTSQNELAEPFKYSNYFRTSSTAVSRIPQKMLGHHGAGPLPTVAT